MKYSPITFVVAICLVITSVSCQQNGRNNFSSGLTKETTSISSESKGTLKIDDLTISQPIEEGGLQVFLIRGNEELKNKRYITLASALNKKLVKVKETGSVNELSIDNNSDEHVFIHSGDIVKGGKQDRTIAHDVIIPPGAKNISLQSFCVEQGRWQQREGENVGNFESTTKMLSSRKLKLAAKYDNDQSKVWQNVDEQQKELKDKVSKMQGYDVEVRSEVSETSLQLTLESKELEQAKKKMEKKFIGLLDTNTNAIGYAYAINGEIFGVDIYNNKRLFEEMWDKIAESILTETISNNSTEDFTKAKPLDVAHFISSMNESGNKITSKAVNAATNLNTTENDKGNILFSVEDKKENKWLHKNYMKKDIDSKNSGSN